MEGRWDVSGQGASGLAVGFQGTIEVRSTTAAGISGAYDVLENAGQGAQRRLSGPIGGRMVSSTTVEFDVQLPGVARRHVATLMADTLRGNWFDLAANGSVDASGSFRAVRR